MNNERQHIEKLLNRFMSGESTLAEERELGQYFATHDVDAEWSAYKQMFAYFDQGMPLEQQKSTPKRLIPLWTRRVAVAATLVVTFVTGLHLLDLQNKKQTMAEQPTVTQMHEEQPIMRQVVESPSATVQPASIAPKGTIALAHSKTRHSKVENATEHPAVWQQQIENALDVALMEEQATEAEMQEQIAIEKAEYALLLAQANSELNGYCIEAELK